MSALGPYIYIDDDGKTDAERYLEGCLDGTYKVGRTIKRLAKKMLKEIAEGCKGRWHYSREAATRPVKWIEKFCKIPSAEKAGQPFILEPYERCIIELTFGFVDDDGVRRFREVFVMIGRKNGKTALCAALNLYMLTSDNKEAKGLEIINGATSLRQANLCYGATKDMADMSPALSKRIRSGVVTKQGITGLNYDAKKNALFTISGNPKSSDGYNMYFGVLDELAACKDNGSVYGLLKGSQNIPGSLLFMISTNGHVRNNIFDDRLDYAHRWLDGKLEDERFLPILYTLDDRSQWTDPECWVMTNPGLGTVKSQDAMAELVSQAMNNPRSRNEVLTKQFNMPVEAYTSLLSMEECRNDATFTFDPKTDRYCVVGFDLADRGDLNAAVAMYMRPGDDHIYERCCCWIAEEQIKINSNLMKERDCLPYTVWSTTIIDRDPVINIAQGDKVDSRWIIDFLRQLASEGLYPRYIGYDGWHVDDWLERELKMLAGEQNVRAIPQTARVLSPAMKEHQIDLRANRIVDNANPLLITCRANVQSKTDAVGNWFPQKRDLRPNLRIDMYMAELFAYIQLKDHWDDYQAIISG